MDDIISKIEEFALAYFLEKRGMLGIKVRSSVVMMEIKEMLSEVFLELEEAKRKLMFRDSVDEER